MQLKQYQKDALRCIENYFVACSQKDTQSAFAEIQPNMAYQMPHNNLQSVPYVCLRIPTGGGKTLLSAHCIATIAHSYLQVDYPVVLWLVPSDTIKKQTAEALKNPQHPYRAALDNAFNRNVLVIVSEDFTLIRPQDLQSKTIIVVSTIQNFRTTSKENRKIYAFNENLAPHFERLPVSVKNKLDKVEVTDIQENGLQEKYIGQVKCSFANLLKAYRPLVIVDEAHNARTPLTFDVLANLNPSAIVEFTATPDKSSNVLYHVSAYALKVEEMIKLPIVLTEHKSWQQAINGAVLERAKLEQKAQYEKEYIRPIVLFQAEPKSKNKETVTVDKLKQYLIDECGINEQEIAVVTGEQKELDNINLFDLSCPIKFVITVEALKEGWDCAFAYVFCSVQKVSSSKDAEQLLGRVLRMPYAKQRTMEELNRAYAHLSSSDFGQVAKELQDKLIAMGFEALEVADMLQMQQSSFRQPEMFNPEDYPLFQNPTAEQVVTVVELDKKPELEQLNQDEKKQLTISEKNGVFVVQVKGDIGEKLEQVLIKSAPKAQQEQVKQQINIHNAQVAKYASPAQKGEKFAPIPLLCVHLQGELMLFEDYLADYDWNLQDYPAKLPNFKPQQVGNSWALDIEENKVNFQSWQQDWQLHLANQWLPNPDKNDLVRWLDKQVRTPDILQNSRMNWLSRLVDDLLSQPNIDLAVLIQQKFVLAIKIKEKIEQYRQDAQKQCYQQPLDLDLLCVSEEYQYTIDFNRYVPQPPYYSGRYKFQKHYFGNHQIGNLKDSGEEFDCAVTIDSLKPVKHWVRNPVHRGFALPLAHQHNFYPDFIAELNDGRILIVEYKGADRKSNDDSREKRIVGESWEKASGGKCLFVMAVKKDEQGRNVQEQLQNKLQ